MRPVNPPRWTTFSPAGSRARLYDTYRQSWVASPEPVYVGAGNTPLRTPLAQFQLLLDAPLETVDVKGKPVPTVSSGLSDAERQLLRSRGLLNAQGRITPLVIDKRKLETPEALLNQELWDSLYDVPKGEITIEHVQHAFYMAANYGFQILNGNFAAAIDDYELKLRFMNDLATYRIDVSWLWTVLRHQAVVTKDGFLKRPALTDDGVEPAENAGRVPAGTRFTPELFQKLWEVHNEWTYAFFAEQDRRGDPGRFDRAKAPVIMELLNGSCCRPATSSTAPASSSSWDRPARRSGRRFWTRSSISPATRSSAGWRQAPRVAAALVAHDYVHDIFPED